VEPKERSVHVHALEIRAVRGAEIELRVHCGKGFYVRALARDLARALCTLDTSRHSGARKAPFRARGERRVSALARKQGRLEAARQLLRAVIPIEAALEDAPRFMLDAEGEQHALHGKVIALQRILAGEIPRPDVELEPVLLCNDAGTLLALARYCATACTWFEAFDLAASLRASPLLSAAVAAASSPFLCGKSSTWSTAKRALGSCS